MKLKNDKKGEVYLDDSDIIDEIIHDNEDLPDIDIDDDDDPEDDSVHTFTAHSGEVYAVACNPVDAALVATGGADDKGFLWKIGNGDWNVELNGHEDSISCLAFSADGQLLASGGVGAAVQIWDTSGNHKHTIEDASNSSEVEFEWIRWHPRRPFALAGSTDSIASMWDAEKGVLLNTFYGHGESVTCGDFTSDDNIICTGSTDATLRIWDTRRSEAIRVVRGRSYHTEGLTCLAMGSGSGSTLALTGAENGSINVVHVPTGKVVNSVRAHSDSVTCIGLAQSAPCLATGGADNKLIIWDLRQLLSDSSNWELRWHSSSHCICDHEAEVTCLTWLGASRYLATGCSDGKILIWDSSRGECVRTLHGHCNSIQSLCVSSDQDFLVSVSFDGTARVFVISEFR